ncbi:Holliday junction resolvase RuvX [Parvibium lacunae]|uniref:Putative pre-16S rRNA nuclease n=1 Tax=Parvibium lacunae TaxID=1888893 RepID=A0A368L4X4_9BURK|nr:Holliday junction resolvase RuvX [Parvibium lacunae]RCS58523.1 Holliday junction resolvase RuvX [Parvibium lacunae]
MAIGDVAIPASSERAAPVAQTYLAFDFGTARIGVAVGNSLTHSAQPLEIIATEANQVRFARIEALLREWQPNHLIVGRPLYPDGTAHEMTARADKFARQLSGRFGLPVSCVDERYSSVCADTTAKHVDAHAACLLLEQFFHEKRHLT